MNISDQLTKNAHNHVPSRSFLLSSLAGFIQALSRELKGLAEHHRDFVWDTIGGLLIPEQQQQHAVHVEQGALPQKLKLTVEDIYNESCVLPPLELGEESEDDENQGEDEEEDEDEDEEETPEIADEDEAENTQEVEVDIDTSHLLVEDDLDTHYRVLEAVLGQRNESIKDYLLSLKRQHNTTVANAFDDAFEILDQELKDSREYSVESVEEARRKREEAHQEAIAVSETVEQIECVPKEHVSVLIEAGLDALVRNRDLRSALLGTLKEIDPPLAEGLILDADLQTEPPLPDSIPSFINIRRMLDRPILPLLIAALDLGLDKTVDYSHLLDPELGQLLGIKLENLCQHLEPGALEEGLSPGKIIFNQLLRIAGKAKLPLPDQAKQFIAQSQNGQNLFF